MSLSAASRSLPTVDTINRMRSSTNSMLYRIDYGGNQMNVKETLAQLVAINSVSFKTNFEIVEYLQGRCETAGFTVKSFSYQDETGLTKTNLIALAGAEFSANTKATLALVGHTDTVPFDPKWNEALKLTERDGRLFGRGSCDTKGFVAA